MTARDSYTSRDGSLFTEYPDMGFSVEYRDASHSYAIHEGATRRPAISVTSVLRVLDKPALLRWAEAAGAEGAAILARQGELDGVPAEEAVERVRLFKLGMDAKRDAGADRGTLVHRVLEEWSREGTVPDLRDFAIEHRGYVQGLCRFLLDHQPTPIAMETVVASRLHGFAGRFDLLATLPSLLETPTIIDLKTARNAAIYPEAHAQTAAYALAIEECGLAEDPGILLVAVGEDGEYVTSPGMASGEDFLAILETSRVMARLRAATKAAAR